MRCQHTTVGGSWACAKCPLEKYVDRHPRGAECAVRVLGARLSTRGIPRLSRSRASPCPALAVRGIQGTASERITTVSLDSTRSQLFSNSTGHPARLGCRASGLAPRRLHPATEMRHDGSEVMRVPITQKERHTPRRHQPSDLMQYGLRHCQRAVTDLDAQQQFGLRIDRGPDPVGGPGEPLDRLGFTDVTVSHRTKHRVEFIELDLSEV